MMGNVPGGASPTFCCVRDHRDIGLRHLQYHQASNAPSKLVKFLIHEKVVIAELSSSLQLIGQMVGYILVIASFGHSFDKFELHSNACP